MHIRPIGAEAVSDNRWEQLERAEALLEGHNLGAPV